MEERRKIVRKKDNEWKQKIIKTRRKERRLIMKTNKED